MSYAPLMPKATAVWLLENTALTFQQIADFCGLHLLEVKAIADGDVGVSIRGLDPVISGKLTREEIAKASADPNYRLQMNAPKVVLPPVKKKKGPRYTPLSRRQDRPDAISWILKHHPELPDSAIVTLVGTTKTTIQSIRNRTHWNSANLKPSDPVILGLCTQLDLDLAVRKVARASETNKKSLKHEPLGETLRPAADVLDEKDEGHESLEN